jgi:hypothetical protein
MAENHKNTVFTVKQQPELLKKFETGEWVILLATDYQAGTD